MVPTPIEFEGPNTSAIDVNSSGADDPAARNVAPATSGVRPSTCVFVAQEEEDAVGAGGGGGSTSKVLVLSTRPRLFVVCYSAQTIPHV